MNDSLKSLTRNLFLNDPETESRIRLDTERHRKGFGTISLFYPDRTPVKKARIRLALKKHEFQFGCNAFMYEEFPEPERNRAYSEKFGELFNLAVIPFYWSDLEPESGRVRFAENSPKCARRPAPDLLLKYCEKHNITPKGHPLLWHSFYPNWLKREPRGLMNRIEQRIAEIAERYKYRIGNFDVVNEVLGWDVERFRSSFMPERHAEFAFRMAEKYFPAGTVLNYNETPWGAWKEFNGEYTPLAVFIRELLAQGLKIDGLGLQYHMFFKSAEAMLQASGEAKYYNPRHLFSLMDIYAKLGIPMNISEISIPGNEAFGGEELQAEVAERLFRIWFSHPACNGIIWWNLVDGTGAYAPLGSLVGENFYRAGMLNYDFSEKPVYKAFKRLLKQEWNTRCEMDYQEGALNKFHGFYGDYVMKIETDAGSFEQELSLCRNANSFYEFILDDPSGVLNFSRRTGPSAE